VIDRAPGFEWGGLAVFLLAMASPAPTDGSIHRITLPLPERAAAAPQIDIVVGPIDLPRRRAAKFYVYAEGAGSADALLGSFAALAESRDAAGSHRVGPFRVNVTRTLRRWMDQHRDARQVPLVIKAMDGARNPVPVAIGSVSFEIPKPS
jgi:hypothetical protein